MNLVLKDVPLGLHELSRVPHIEFAFRAMVEFVLLLCLLSFCVLWCCRLQKNFHTGVREYFGSYSDAFIQLHKFLTFLCVGA
jgi:hypothetical protein